jgi:RNA polymerase sigma-70 factor (ECF subfamily)
VNPVLAALRMQVRDIGSPDPTVATGLDFDDLYEEHFDYVWRTARRLGAPASALDDVVQDAFVVVYRRLPQFDGSALRAWLFVIVRNVVRDVRRTLRRKPGHTPSESDELLALLADPMRGTPEDITASNESLRLVELLLEALSDEKREVLVLTEFDELSAPEIALALKIPLNTVYSRLRAARADFGAAWERAETSARAGTRRDPRHGGSP